MAPHRLRRSALPATTDPWRAIPPDFHHGLLGAAPRLPLPSRTVVAEPATDLPAKVRGTEAFRGVVHDALAAIRRSLSVDSAESCRSYFRQEGVDLDRWITDWSPPFVVEVPRSWFPPVLRRRACAASQAGPPHLYLFIASDCARRNDTGAVASLLLHELGHLARRDVEDAEPIDFFARCDLGEGIRPGRFH